VESFLNIFAPIALAIFAVGLGLRLGRWAKAVVARRSTVHRRNSAFPVNYKTLSLVGGAKDVVSGPVAHFHRNANRTWSRGYLLYHIAIITEVVGYTLAAIILFARVAVGQTVPDIALHAEGSTNYDPANLMAIVFGNGEPLSANYLFGGFGPYFIGITWVAVGFAVAGNLHLMYTLLRRRNAAVVADIDPAARGVRIRGRMSWDRLAVRLLIFTIIWTELLARLDAVSGIVFVHAALGLALFTLFPFTYLFHMVYNVVALYYSARRRAVRAVA
jgi:nitrate reductase gamma subunit